MVNIISADNNDITRHFQLNSLLTFTFFKVSTLWPFFRHFQRRFQDFFHQGQIPFLGGHKYYKIAQKSGFHNIIIKNVSFDISH